MIVTGDDARPTVLDLRTDSVSLLCDCVVGRFPELDPTGQYLYYEDAAVADGWATSIYRMDLATGDTTHIVGGSFPAVSPDGSEVVIGNITRKGYHGKLYKVKPDGSAARRFGLGISPAYSPSGNRIAVARFGDDGRSYIWLMDPDGGNPKRITF